MKSFFGFQREHASINDFFMYSMFYVKVDVLKSDFQPQAGGKFGLI